ncbi:hypothetical protein CK203_022285 [Vitis vinifera]|uniref:Uncharacterized protein n=1 Tax=Vitis vinifera TaxID=29760 RepID=A0A438I9C5_VITVI|nr:hypothetical protein CK203_022285 [Vitis vinifera]
MATKTKVGEEAQIGPVAKRSSSTGSAPALELGSTSLRQRSRQGC